MNWRHTRAITFRKLRGRQGIIITGASSGFGKLTAKRAAEMGGKIVLAARSEEKLKETVAEIKAAGGEASYIVTDVAKRTMFSQWLNSR